MHVECTVVRGNIFLFYKLNFPAYLLIIMRTVCCRTSTRSHDERNLWNHSWRHHVALSHTHTFILSLQLLPISHISHKTYWGVYYVTWFILRYSVSGPASLPSIHPSHVSVAVSVSIWGRCESGIGSSFGVEGQTNTRCNSLFFWHFYNNN